MTTKNKGKKEKKKKKKSYQKGRNELGVDEGRLRILEPWGNISRDSEVRVLHAAKGKGSAGKKK